MNLASGFLPGILLWGQNLLLCKLLLFLDQISGGGELKSLRGCPLVEESQCLDSTMSLLNSVNNRFSFKIRISHHIFKSFSARIIATNKRTHRNLKLAFDNLLIL